jgi:hypothetical protein
VANKIKNEGVQGHIPRSETEFSKSKEIGSVVKNK